MFRKTILVAALAGACGTVQAQTTDDFNRPDGSGLGPNYTAAGGNLAIFGNKAVSSNFSGLALYSGSSSTSASVDVATRGDDAGSYVAIALGYLSGSNYFIKVQDNNGDGAFDSYGFYTGNNEYNGLHDLNPFFTGKISVNYIGTVASLIVEGSWNTQVFTHDYGFTPGSLDVGLGINRQGVADNLSFDAASPTGVPEPTSWAMMIVGFGLAGAGIRTRRVRAAFA